ncbi:VHS-domain-containing protein [Abortiporus biennis]
MFPAHSSDWLSESTSPLKVLITRATYPSQPEPNYALNLEVAEYINHKKANTPREAAMTIVQLVNHRNPHIAMLALALLDTLVQHCGYPFHLQVATKEFLNELVRRFPERPPPFPGPVMSRILELIQVWKEGICTESRFKEDLGNIRDMHRLLTFKGYRFRDLPRRDQNVQAAAANLKTAEELENEDREAQSAKLQELIRRGTPRDLAQAQELMKSLAGANPEAKPDYKSQALTELNKLESKVILLNEMLDNVDVQRGERFATGDVYDQVASILKNARPKIQGWISNAETEDSESLDTFLQINDQINTVLNRYESFKKGDFVAAANPIPSELTSPGGPSRQTQNDLSLIDFDDSAPANGTGGTSTINELESLFGGAPAPSAAQPSPPQLSFIQQQQPVFSTAPQSSQPSTSTPLSTYGIQPTVTSQSHPGTPTPQGNIRLPGTPQVQPSLGSIRLGSPAPNFFGGSGGSTSSPATPAGASVGNVMGNGFQAQHSSPHQQPQPQQLWQALQGQPIQQQQQQPHTLWDALQPGGQRRTQPAYGGGPQAPRPSSTTAFSSNPTPYATSGSSSSPFGQPTVQQQTVPQQQPQANQAQGKDPFADLAGLF